MKKLLAILPMALVLGLAACSDQSSEPKAQAPAATESKPAAPAATEAKPAAPAEPTATEAKPAAPAAPAEASDVSEAAINACLAAVKNETGEPDVVMTSKEWSQANSMVMLGVGAQRAPWKCLVSNDGTVQEVSFTGSEGAK
ncbi:MAG: hypothetical protein KDJ74_11710 [Notoacmeibacter sp.]|nr:hypothetical protein [Notoacmeibacter sp.]